MMRSCVLLSQKNESFRQAATSKYISPEELAAFCLSLREKGKTIATLNGSFDLLHAGHLEIIFQAAKQADLLIMGLNTDRSIQEYKSPKRPIVPLEFRMQMCAALEMVDYVTWFDEVDPRAMIKKIKPDVHVNGSEYGLCCIEAEVVRECGARLHIVSLVPGLSTSQLIRKVVEVCA
jgi:D-glycero-beta-D-manno-heptose 1-phosphate adenylyltransferase